MSLRIEINHSFAAFRLDVGFESQSSTTVLFGRSGSGKTTLINAVAGLLTPHGGRISLGDRVLFDADHGIDVPVHLRRIGYVFQDARLFPHMSVSDNLNYGARFAPDPMEAKERDRIVEVLGIGALLARRPAALSGGEKQRVALGRALISAPELLLMDEPLAALDDMRKNEILTYLQQARKDGGPAMIYVTHDMNEIVRLADDLVVMKEGRSVLCGAAEKVLGDPANIPLIGVQDAGALLGGQIMAHHEDGLSEVQTSAATLHLPKVDLPLGTKVRLRVRAQDVILSSERPEGLSSQNLLPVTVEAVHAGSGPGVAVALRSGTDRILARITARAQGQMQLEKGQQIWAILKASSVPPTAIATHSGLVQAKGQL